jgi:hypothetical protein
VEAERQNVTMLMSRVEMATLEGMNKVGILYLYLMIVDEEIAVQVQLTLD